MSLSHISRLKLAPGMVDSVNVVGNNFWVIYCPVDIEIMRPGGEWGLYSQGTGIDNLPNGETFNRITVRNPTIGDVTVVIYVGGPLYRDSRLSVMEPKTVGTVNPTTTLNATTGVTLSGIPSGDKIRRKAVILTNRDVNLELQIRDAAGGVIASVFGRQTYILNVSEEVEMYNPNGSGVACNISEIWWTL